MISLIVAASENNVIGRDNALPWDLPDDLKYFKEKTKGHPIIMGRKNFESIGRVLPGRQNIIVTRQEDWSHEGCTVVHSVGDAIGAADTSDETFVIGGGEIYNLALPMAERIYLTRVHARVEGDILFPELDGANWKLVSEKKHEKDEKNEHAFTCEIWERK
ncbi:MAG: type 3 dihydrofolate reductase [bacterium]|nr:type 3 dihydrofolate reductase [bacterium]